MEGSYRDEYLLLERYMYTKKKNMCLFLCFGHHLCNYEEGLYKLPVELWVRIWKDAVGDILSRMKHIEKIISFIYDPVIASVFPQYCFAVYMTGPPRYVVHPSVDFGDRQRLKLEIVEKLGKGDTTKLLADFNMMSKTTLWKINEYLKKA